MRRALVVLAVGGGGCGGSTPAMPMVDAGPVRTATGTRLVDHAAVIGGLTRDDYVIYSDNDDATHTVANVIPAAGGASIAIVTTAGTGKPDIRFDEHNGVVFAWTDRGNRMATLATWSAAAGVVARGMGTRPGRAAATADGRAIVYETMVTDTTAQIAIAPTAGAANLVGTANSADDTCWKNTDFANVGAQLLVRYCVDPAATFALRTFTANGASADVTTDATTAAYGEDRAIWMTAAGALMVSTDGKTAVPIAGGAATGAVEIVTTHDLAHVAWRTSGGAIASAAGDGTGGATTLAASGALALGALAPDGTKVLYASKLDDEGGAYVQPFADVQLGVAGGASQTLVAGTTSCPGCSYDSFSLDGKYALVLDPIDNLLAADGAGPMVVRDTTDGHVVTTVGSIEYTAIALPDGNFLFIDAVRDPASETGWRYGIVVQALTAGAAPTVIAQGANGFAVDRARTKIAFSFGGTDDQSGLWLAPL